jgi:hypothetical protein
LKSLKLAFDLCLSSEETDKGDALYLFFSHYDFDEYRTDKSLGSMLNNWGYDMQNIGVIKPYEWDAAYTVYGDWR